ncbi:hypothetical protein [Rhodanobacter geophilus]|uniref:Secreted protein n=1 Tax=Rhodanobacter geophilus TaxID=3162488 RepID=A0ABV3QUV3_9GAMM
MAYQLCKWLFTVLALTVSAKVVAAGQCQGFKFEQVTSLSLQDFGRLTQQKVVAGEPGSVVFTPFDEEDYPRKDQFRALGFVFARVGDLGETPIGGYIWISRDAKYRDYKVVKKTDSVSVTFRLEGAQHCAASQLDFELKQMGRVYVNGAAVGTIK